MEYTQAEILQTVRMIEMEHLDVRTVTLGLSLRDCVRATVAETAEAVREKIERTASRLVPTVDEIGEEYGLRIANKRISITPASLVFDRARSASELLPLARAIDEAAKRVGVDFIGGYSALVHKGETPGTHAFVDSIPEALAATERLCSSLNLATTRAGINMDAVRRTGEIIKEMAELTRERGGLACAKFVCFANAVEDNPFMAGAFHGPGEAEAVINVGVSGPGVVNHAVRHAPKDAPLDEMAELIKKLSFKLARAGALGTTAALALLTDAVKKGGAMASSAVGGMSGAFIPVSEDAAMIEAAQLGALTLEKLEAMTSVCSVGLDMVAVPGDTSAETIAAVIADEMAIGVMNNKTTAVRIIPAPGKVVGDVVEFGGLLGSAPVMPINGFSPGVFIRRGGRIPAPIHSLRN